MARWLVLCPLNPIPLMKTLRLLGLSVFVGGVLQGSAALQSVQLSPDNLMPQYPGSLILSGITRGYAVIAVSIDAEGNLHDALPLAYTQEQLARASLEALRGWKFLPARLDGNPVPVQVDFRFDFSLQGAVITTNIVNHFFFDSFENAGDNAPKYQPGRPSRLDSPLVRLAGESPKYAREAERAGVQGTVQVRFYIDETGAVRLPSVVAGADPYLMEQAVEAVRGWKFEAPTIRGLPVLVAARQEFKFGGK